MRAAVGSCPAVRGGSSRLQLEGCPAPSLPPPALQPRPRCRPLWKAAGAPPPPPTSPFAPAPHLYRTASGTVSRRRSPSALRPQK